MEYYEKDRRVKSVMIEVNRRLYMDAPGIKGKRFGEINSLLRQCISILEKGSEG